MKPKDRTQITVEQTDFAAFVALNVMESEGEIRITEVVERDGLLIYTVERTDAFDRQLELN